MRWCPVCRKPPRIDDPLARVCVNPADAPEPVTSFIVSHLGSATLQGTVGSNACRSCLASLSNQPEEPAPRYPWGGPVPIHPESQPQQFRSIDVCGICRLALHEDDGGGNIRLHPDDLHDCQEIEPGGYRACRDCIKRFEPRVRRRLWEAGMFDNPHSGRPAFETVRKIGGDMLM